MISLSAFRPGSGAQTIDVFSGSSFERLGMQWHRASTFKLDSEESESFSVFLWASSAACGSPEGGSDDSDFRRFRVVAAPPRLGSHIPAPSQAGKAGYQPGQLVSWQSQVFAS